MFCRYAASDKISRFNDTAKLGIISYLQLDKINILRTSRDQLIYLKVSNKFDVAKIMILNTLPRTCHHLLLFNARRWNYTVHTMWMKLFIAEFMNHRSSIIIIIIILPYLEW